MAKASNKDPLQKHTMNLFAGDFEALSLIYPELGAAVVIRRLVRMHIEKCEASLPEPSKKDIIL